jgi:hypothetical protein
MSMMDSDRSGFPKLPMGVVRLVQRWHWGRNLGTLAGVGIVLSLLSYAFLSPVVAFVFAVPMFLAALAEQQQPSPDDLKPWLAPKYGLTLSLLGLTAYSLWMLVDGVRQLSDREWFGAAGVLMGALGAWIVFVMARVLRREWQNEAS